MSSEVDPLNAGGILIGKSEFQQMSIGFSKYKPNDSQKEIRAGEEGHLITFAPTGSGKTWTLAIPALLDYCGSVVAFDPKGELSKATAGVRQAMGQEVIVLDPFGITGYESAALNPMDLMLASEPTIENASCLATSIINEISGADPFWEVSARNLVAQLLLYISLESPKALRNLHELYFLLNQSPKDVRLTIKDMARSKERSVSVGAHALPVEADRTMACILASARRFTEVFRGDVVRTATSTSSFGGDIFDGKKHVSIYLVLPPAYLQSHAALIRIWMETLISTRISRGTEQSRHTLFLIDEAAQLGSMDFLETSITLLRSYGVRCWTFWQDPQQLKACYPTRWQTIFNNCRYHTVFGRQSFLATEALKPLYGQIDRRVMQCGVFAELGESPVSWRRPTVDEVLAKVARGPAYEPPATEGGNGKNTFLPSSLDGIGDHEIPF